MFQDPAVLGAAPTQRYSLPHKASNLTQGCPTSKWLGAIHPIGLASRGYTCGGHGPLGAMRCISPHCTICLAPSHCTVSLCCTVLPSAPPPCTAHPSTVQLHCTIHLGSPHTSLCGQPPPTTASCTQVLPLPAAPCPLCCTEHPGATPHPKLPRFQAPPAYGLLYSAQLHPWGREG